MAFQVSQRSDGDRHVRKRGPCVTNHIVDAYLLLALPHAAPFTDAAAAEAAAAHAPPAAIHHQQRLLRGLERTPHASASVV